MINCGTDSLFVPLFVIVW